MVVDGFRCPESSVHSEFLALFYFLFLLMIYQSK